jgi:hypothetical protein
MGQVLGVGRDGRAVADSVRGRRAATTHTLTLETVNSLGNLYKDEGRLGKAEKMYERALRGYQKVLWSQASPAVQASTQYSR